VARLTPDNVRRAKDLIGLYPQSRSALIPMLHVAQEQDGWLTPEAMEHVGELLGITPAEVYGTASFYDMLFTEPVGRHLVSVCTNLACLLNGGVELLEHAEASLGVAPGGTTHDGEFTLEEVECIAFCGAAPCLAVNWRFFGSVSPDTFDQLVDDLRSGRLADEVPPHGTLCRVRRNVGLLAGGPPSPPPTPAPPGPTPGTPGVTASAPAPTTDKGEGAR
jgi:NADH-quinone oxidoreductase E subunit